MYLKDWLWNICSICPSFYSLASFITCFSYSIGNFIACLKFLYLECLPSVGESQCCFYWIMVIMLCISTFLCLRFSVYLDLWMHSLLSPNFTTRKPFKNPKSLVLFDWNIWDYVGLFSCSLETNSGINIFGTVTGERIGKQIFLWDTYHFTGFKRWT